MYAIAIATLGAAILAWQVATCVPAQQAMLTQTIAMAAANNFWSYREAVAAYQYAYPAASGTIADGSLTFQVGYKRNAAWTNIISSGLLFTYSNAAIPAGTVTAIANRGGRSMMIGIAAASTASAPTITGRTMITLTNGLTGWTLPAVIPNGAIVVIGN